MGVAAVFDRQVMKTKLFGQVLEVLAGGIAHVGPDDVAGRHAQLADVGCNAVFSKRPVDGYSDKLS